MGTRADFYVGKGKRMEWLGSLGWDAYPHGIPKDIRWAKCKAEYMEAVAAFLAGRDDATLPKQGWPWPWDSSHTTDYAYTFSGGRVWASAFGARWFLATHKREFQTGKVWFPNMKGHKRVTLGPRSGLMVIAEKRRVAK